jgi:hypothetical protein
LTIEKILTGNRQCPHSIPKEYLSVTNEMRKVG